MINLPLTKDDVGRVTMTYNLDTRFELSPKKLLDDSKSNLGARFF